MVNCTMLQYVFINISVLILLSHNAVIFVNASRNHRDPNPFPSFEQLEDQATADIAAIDVALDEIISTNVDGIIIDRYSPSKFWLWRQWSSTVFRSSLLNVRRSVISTFIVCCLLRKLIFGDWNVWKHPNNNIISSHQETKICIIQSLNCLNKVWKNLLPLTTVVLTLFVAQAYNYWIGVYQLCRNIQHRMNDIEMLLSTHVRRKNNNKFGRRRSTLYTTSGEEFLRDINHNLRAFHVLFWASQTRRFRILITDRGLSRLVAKDVLTQQEKEELDSHISISRTQKHWIVLDWVIFKCKEAQCSNNDSRGLKKRRNNKECILEGGYGLEQVLLDRICSLRTCCSQIKNKVAGRMVFAYAHYVSILVDAFLFMASIVQYNELGIWSVVSTGILTLFYSGLMNLSFDLLDPMLNDRENNGDGSCDGDDTSVYLDISVLIRESTSTAQRWVKAGSKFKW